MKVFCMWDQYNIKSEYQECIDKLLLVYPSLVIERFEKPLSIERSDIYSDELRFKILSEIDDDCLYLDCDCLPGTEIFTGEGFDKLSFCNLRGGMFDYWAIYKPRGKEQECLDIINRPNKRVHIQTFINNNSHKYGLINGYPDDKHFRHLHLATWHRG